MDKKIIIAGTGHRPKYCPCQYDRSHPWLINLKKRLENYLIEMEFGDARRIIRSGGAIGWDTWIAQVALDLDLELHLYLPFPDQGKKWPAESFLECERIKENADVVNYVSDKYHPKAFHQRDIEMITGSDKVVSLLNPEVKSGGTYFTVQKAKEMNIHVINFWKD